MRSCGPSVRCRARRRIGDLTFLTLVRPEPGTPQKRGGTVRIRANLAATDGARNAIEEAWAAAVLEPYPYLHSM